MTHIINPVYYQDFILSGKPEFTLKRGKTGNQEIFVVKRAKHDNLYWVNNQLREFLGRLMPVPEAGENMWCFQPRPDELLNYQIRQIRIFEHFWDNLAMRILEPYRWDITMINHTGRCGHCHRPLTHPESIPIGIGPDCFKKLGLTTKQLISLP